MTTLISTYLSLSTSYGTILTVPAGIFVCTFPEIPVQTWCKGVSMIAGGFPVPPHSESPKPAAGINCLCAPSSPAGPAWLEPCRHLSTAPRRRHHRHPRDRPAGEDRAPPRPSPGDVCRGSITDLDLLMEAFPGAAGIFGGHPLRAAVGEGPPRLERGERDRHRERAGGGEGLRGAGRGCRIVLLGLRRHPSSGIVKRSGSHPSPDTSTTHRR